MKTKIWTSPRLYLDHDLNQGMELHLDKDNAHHLFNVLRKGPNDAIRIFNGRDGEWLGQLTSIKGRVDIDHQLKEQPKHGKPVHLFCPLIKKARLDMMIEKAVELGVTDIHPILTDRCEARKLNTNRYQKQIIAAACQCERLVMPRLHPLMPLVKIRFDKIIHVAIEREERHEFAPKYDEKEYAIMVGPEGGFTKTEKEHLDQQRYFAPVILGTDILRAETAALYMLSLVKKAMA